jgi:hypothetical protein
LSISVLARYSSTQIYQVQIRSDVDVGRKREECNREHDDLGRGLPPKPSPSSTRPLSLPRQRVNRAFSLRPIAKHRHPPSPFASQPVVSSCCTLARELAKVQALVSSPGNLAFPSLSTAEDKQRRDLGRTLARLVWDLVGVSNEREMPNGHQGERRSSFVRLVFSLLLGWGRSTRVTRRKS